MSVLVTGSAGHLGEGLVRSLRAAGRGVVGLDVVASPSTDVVGSVLDRHALEDALDGADAVVHAATLHKPHLGTHDAASFVEVNAGGTAVLLEATARRRVGAFIFVSTTSAFGWALRPPQARPAVWVTEDVAPVPRNVYGVTKLAAEELCRLAHDEGGLPCVVLRAARFFPEEDDDPAVRDAYAPENVQVNELLYRRVDLADVVGACRAALERAPSLGFARYVVSSTTPFARDDLARLRADAPGVVRRLFPDCEKVYAARGWRMFPSIDRVYDNAAARRDLGWEPGHDFAWARARLAAGEAPRSKLAAAVGSKGYHAGGAASRTPSPSVAGG